MNDNEQTNAPHDTRLKELFRNKEAFISLLKDCIKEAWLDDLDEDSLKLSNHSFILQDFNKKEADIVYEATIKNGKEKVIFYALLELQRKVDYRMPYRLLLYIVEVLRHYYNQADVKERERKNFKFPAVIPLVFFNGSQKWTVPLNLKEMFFGYEQFGENLLNFNYALVDVKGYDDKSVKDFRSRLLKIMMMFEKSRDFMELSETIEKYHSEIAGLNDEEFRIISAAFEILSKIYGYSEENDLGKIIQTKNAGRADSMLSDIIANPTKYKRQYDEQLIKKSKEEMAKEMAKEMLLENEPMSKIMRYTKLTEEEIEEIAKTL